MSHINYGLASELLRGRGGYELDSGATSRRRTQNDEEEKRECAILLFVEASVHLAKNVSSRSFYIMTYGLKSVQINFDIEIGM